MPSNISIENWRDALYATMVMSAFFFDTRADWRAWQPAATKPVATTGRASVACRSDSGH
jgi:hypothetical protein